MAYKKTWHDAYKEARSVGDAVADRIAAAVGSWGFVYVHVVWFSLWIGLPIEPSPYPRLTLIVSLEAILLATLIMMSQNRQSARDRHQAQADFETDVRAEQEIEKLREQLSHIENEKLDKILRLLEMRK